jgi:hypothetical protein
VRSADRGKVTILGLKNSLNYLAQDEYIGMYKDDTMATDREQLQLDIERSLPILGPQCYYECKTGMAKCDWTCSCSKCVPPWEDEDNEECPIIILRAAERGLAFLETLPMMRLVFSNPALATSNNFHEQGKLIYSHQ